MTKTLFIIGTILLMLGAPALAGQTSEMDWGRVKTLYGGEGDDVQYERSGGGNYGTLWPVSPTLEYTEHQVLFVFEMLQEAQRQRPELEIWRDPELQELMAGGDRGVGDWFKKVFGWVREHVQFSMDPSGFNILVITDNGCLGFGFPWIGNWSFGPCV